jgi:hypothetical protein
MDKMSKIKEILETGLERYESTSSDKFKQLENAKLTLIRLENEIVRLSVKYITEKEGSVPKTSKEELLKIDYSVFNLDNPKLENVLKEANKLIDEYKDLI